MSQPDSQLTVRDVTGMPVAVSTSTRNGDLVLLTFGDEAEDGIAAFDLAADGSRAEVARLRDRLTELLGDG